MRAQPRARFAVVVVATQDSEARARATVRTVAAHASPAAVVDIDGGYHPVAGERVVSLVDAVTHLGLREEARAAAATLGPDDLGFYAGVLGAAYLQVEQGDVPVLVLGAGVHVLGDLRHLLAETAGAAVVPAADAIAVQGRAAAAPLHLWRDPASGLLGVESPHDTGALSRAMYVVRSRAQTNVLRQLAADWRLTATALDVFAVDVGATVMDRAVLMVGAWRGIGSTTLDDGGRPCLDGEPIVTLDLTAFDADRPWTLDPDARTGPRVLLSEHPVLARLAATEAEARRADELALAESPRDPPSRARLDTILRSEARRAERAGAELPDVLGLGLGEDLETWATQLVPEGNPLAVARYLAATRLARPDLQHAFRHVPGPGARGLARWALGSGVHETTQDADLLARAAQDTLAAHDTTRAAGKQPRAAGVNLVGYLAGELGLGESARQVDNALQAAGIPTSTFDVRQDLESRRGAAYRASEPVLRSTSLMCVNGAETAALVPQLSALLKNTRVIGMWYWELEDFPAAHQAGFQVVDEVWAATDYLRDAIARHAPGHLTVRTVTPPLPQAGVHPGRVPPRLGIPADRPWFLFTFDFQSFAVRKNPYGLVEAFTRAFDDRPPPARPVLVIKTINADRHPGDAEQLRVQIAGRDDVLFLDAYLDHAERHVLTSHCTAFVSLHRAEGLGLTVAEAMAWGRPVITTAYGGVMQFCTPDNSFLVDWERGHVERTAGPYVRGLPWAEPDLEHAATLMRAVIDDPVRAAAVGDRAARDIRELHNAEVAGARMRLALAEGDEQWRSARAAARVDRRAEQPEPGPPTEAPADPPATVRGRVRSVLSRRGRG